MLAVFYTKENCIEPKKLEYSNKLLKSGQGIFCSRPLVPSFLENVENVGGNLLN
jgi:hypothetical protein